MGQVITPTLKLFAGFMGEKTSAFLSMQNSMRLAAAGIVTTGNLGAGPWAASLLLEAQTVLSVNTGLVQTNLLGRMNLNLKPQSSLRVRWTLVASPRPWSMLRTRSRRRRRGTTLAISWTGTRQMPSKAPTSTGHRGRQT